MNPERLKLRQWEVNDLKRLAKLFHTPRAAKRFVNTYRLIRVGIPEADLTEFIGSASTPGRYRIAQMLLAIVCGYPNVAPLFLQIMLKQARTPNRNLTWTKFVVACAGMHHINQVAGESATDVDGEQPPKSRAKQNQTKKKSTRQPKLDVEELALDQFNREWQELCEVLSNLDQDFVPENLDSYDDLVRRAARFSFSVSALPE
jgi:hypothetical protein